MSLELENKRALVTGSSSGIGEAIAKRLAREGATVAVHGRNSERTAQVADDIEGAGGKSCIATGDLSSEHEVDAVAETVQSALGGVDILVNCAGGEAAGGGTAEWLDVSSGEWMSAYKSNVVAATRMIGQVVPGMKARGWGRVIQVGSVAGHTPLAMIPDYGAAKAALLNLTVSLSKALARTGVTSNSISPGLTLTPSVENWLRGLAKENGWGDDWETIEYRAVTELVPNRIGRMGRPEDIAHAAAYLANPQSGFMTGGDILIDGGEE